MSQKTDILLHLKEQGSIDPKLALELYGCMRLASRIDELRSDGHSVRMEMQRTVSGKRHARYHLEDSCPSN